MSYGEDVYDFPFDFEDYAVISHPEFPISSKILPERESVLLGGRHQAGLDRPPDAVPHFHIDLGEIDVLDVRVVLDRKRHAIPRHPCV